MLDLTFHRDPRIMTASDKPRDIAVEAGIVLQHCVIQHLKKSNQIEDFPQFAKVDYMEDDTALVDIKGSSGETITASNGEIAVWLRLLKLGESIFLDVWKFHGDYRGATFLYRVDVRAIIEKHLFLPSRFSKTDCYARLTDLELIQYKNGIKI